MKWQAPDKTGRPNVTQAELLEWEDWKRIVEVPKTPQDYSKVVNGRRAVSAKLAGKISACFGIPSDLLEPNVPLIDFKNYLDEDLREPDRHVPVEETRQLLETTRKREKASLEAGRKKKRRADSLYDSLIECYSASPYTAVLEQLSRICLEYGSFLESTGRPDSAIALYGRLTDDFDKRWTFENAEDRRLFSEPVACAMVEKARLLQCKGFTDDAIAVLQEAISRFGEDADKFPSLRAYLLKATQTLRDLGLANGLIDEKGPSSPTLTGDVASAETDLDYIDFLPLPQQKRLAEFRKRFVETGQAVLLLGPQIGVRSGLPDESTIWERLAEAGGLPLQPPPDLCDDIVRIHGSECLHRHLAELLDDEAAPLSDIHQIAARIDFRAYMTTNTDRLMEWALKDAGRAHRSIFFEPDKVLLPDDKTLMVKFCGSVEHPHTLSPYFDPSRIPVEILFCSATTTAGLVRDRRVGGSGTFALRAVSHSPGGTCLPVLHGVQPTIFQNLPAASSQAKCYWTARKMVGWTPYKIGGRRIREIQNQRKSPCTDPPTLRSPPRPTLHLGGTKTGGIIGMISATFSSPQASSVPRQSLSRPFPVSIPGGQFSRARAGSKAWTGERQPQ